MISIILEFVKDVFRAIGMAYYGFASQLGYLERSILVLLLYSTFGIWDYGLNFFDFTMDFFKAFDLDKIINLIKKFFE